MESPYFISARSILSCLNVSVHFQHWNRRHYPANCVKEWGEQKQGM